MLAWEDPKYTKELRSGLVGEISMNHLARNDRSYFIFSKVLVKQTRICAYEVCDTLDRCERAFLMQGCSIVKRISGRARVNGRYVNISGFRHIDL